MDFISAKCPQCGGALQVPQGRNSMKCNYCGTDVVVREANSPMTTTSVNSFFTLGQAAEDAGNHVEAYAYFTKVLELDPRNVDAWIGKGTSAGWQSNLIASRLDEMLSCYNKALLATDNDGLKEVVKLQAAITILQVAKAFFDMSTEHTIQFVSVPTAKFEHIDRCKEIIHACEKAYEFDPELNEIPNFIVDICNRITKLTGLIANDKRFFEAKRNTYTSNVKAANTEKVATKSGMDGGGLTVLMIIGYYVSYEIVTRMFGITNVIGGLVAALFFAWFAALLVLWLLLAYKKQQVKAKGTASN